MYVSYCLKSLCRHFSKYNQSSTVFALSSGQGKCGVAVIRISGKQSGEALLNLTAMKQLPKPRQALLRKIRDFRTGEVIDKGLVLWFPGPRSFTGEDSFELQVHGSAAVVSAIFKSLGSIPNFRLAEPGEFTKRAFYNGKLDLLEVEGLADLLQAETELQRKQAFLQSQGSLSRLCFKWRDTLMKSLAYIEAHIDFDETEEVEDNVVHQVYKEVSTVNHEIKKHLQDSRRGEILRNGVKTVIIGEPNVGKSSVLNLLCQRPAAIVTPLEGTTRDILQTTLNISGYPLVLIDTAGLRSNTQDVIEIEGINRAITAYKSADLVLLVIDATKFIKWKETNLNSGILEYIKWYVTSLNLLDMINIDADTLQSIFKKECLVLFNKLDLVAEKKEEFSDAIIISCITEAGVVDFLEHLTEKLQKMCAEPSEEHPAMSHSRYRQHLTDCCKNLELFLQYYSNHNSISSDSALMAEQLRQALKSIGKLVGVVTTEQLLDVIFRDFCIGK